MRKRHLLIDWLFDCFGCELLLKLPFLESLCIWLMYDAPKLLIQLVSSLILLTTQLTHIGKGCFKSSDLLVSLQTCVEVCEYQTKKKPLHGSQVSKKPMIDFLSIPRPPKVRHEIKNQEKREEERREERVDQTPSLNWSNKHDLLILVAESLLFSCQWSYWGQFQLFHAPKYNKRHTYADSCLTLVDQAATADMAQVEALPLVPQPKTPLLMHDLTELWTWANTQAELYHQ